MLTVFGNDPALWTVGIAAVAQSVILAFVSRAWRKRVDNMEVTHEREVAHLIERHKAAERRTTYYADSIELLRHRFGERSITELESIEIRGQMDMISHHARYI